MARVLSFQSESHRPGNPAPESGIYRVVHSEHRGDHLATIIRDEIFPACRLCRGRVRFFLYARADHMTHDWDLSGPLELDQAAV